MTNLTPSTPEVAATDNAKRDALYERAERVELLERWVRANGQPGSELVKAFALDTSVGNDEGPEDLARLESMVRDAEAQWAKLTPAEQAHILNGWHAGKVPSVADHLRELADRADTSVDWFLMATMTGSGDIHLDAGVEVLHGISLVNVAIRKGAPKEEAIGELRQILAALESHWDAAIAPRDKMLVVEPEELLPVGTLVVDDMDDGAMGVIVGGFKGKNGTLYSYVTPTGEVNSQYGLGLKAAEQVGGLPPVTDIAGNDPLAGRRIGVRA